MSLLDRQEASSRPGGESDGDPLAPPSGPQWPYEFPVPHPYGSAPPLHQLLTGGGGLLSEGDCCHRLSSLSLGSDCFISHLHVIIKPPSDFCQQEVAALDRTAVTTRGRQEGANQSRANRKRALQRTNNLGRSFPEMTAPRLTRPLSLVSLATKTQRSALSPHRHLGLNAATLLLPDSPSVWPWETPVISLWMSCDSLMMTMSHLHKYRLVQNAARKLE